MRILFLDDNEERHKRFRYNSIGCDVTHVYSYAEALAALSGDRFDQVFLDHDLSEVASCGMAGPDEKTGYHVACIVAEMPEEKRPELAVIHSFNTAGAKRMRAALEGAVKYTIERPFSERLAPFRMREEP